MGIFVCKICGKEFIRAGNKKRKYCSNECYHYSRRLTNEIYYENDYAFMLLTKDNITKKVVFDISDIEKINKHKWHLHLRKKDNRYDVCSNSFGSHKERKYIFLARYLLNCPKDLQVDHISRNTLDNRRKNLLIVTNFENNQNKSTNTSGCVGVTWDKSRNKWKATCGKTFIGRYNNFNDAKNARINYITIHKKEFEIKQQSFS